MVAVEEVKARYHGIAACLNPLSPLSAYSHSIPAQPQHDPRRERSNAFRPHALAILLRPRGLFVLVYVWRTGSPGYGEPGDR